MRGGGSGGDTGLGGAMAGIANMVMSLEKGFCGLGVGSGVTFSSSTYSISGNAGQAGNPIAYRAGAIGDKPAIAAIPDDSQQDMMVFAFASPDRIVGEDSCVLVRVGAQPTAAPATRAVQPPAGAAAPITAVRWAREPIEPISRLGRGVNFMVKRTSSRRCSSSWSPRSPIRTTHGSTSTSRTRTAGSAWMRKRNRPQSARSNWTPTPSRSCAEPIANKCSGRALLRMGYTNTP